MTPLQELINKLEQQGVHITDAAKHKLLSAEKQIIIDSFDMGVNCTSDYFAGVRPKYDSAEEYYDGVYSGLAK